MLFLCLQLYLQEQFPKVGYYRLESKCSCNFDRYFQNALHRNCKRAVLLELMYKDWGYNFNSSATPQKELQKNFPVLLQGKWEGRHWKWGVRTELSLQFNIQKILIGKMLHYLQKWFWGTDNYVPCLSWYPSNWPSLDLNTHLRHYVFYLSNTRELR